MKTLITLNIGLTTTASTRLDIHHALGAIHACGVSITTSAVLQGAWQGKPEQTLFVQGFVADPLGVAFRAQLFLASRLLSQHCLAFYCDGKGELVGDNPEGHQFDASLFHFHPEGRKVEPQLSDCQAIQKEHAAKLGKLVNGYTRAGFIAYLESTLIPDLKESGYVATAEDFETAVEFIRQ